jgi:hypothetical protein
MAHNENIFRSSTCNLDEVRTVAENDSCITTLNGNAYMLDKVRT